MLAFMETIKQPEENKILIASISIRKALTVGS